MAENDRKIPSAGNGWTRFRKNPVSLICLLVIFVFSLLAVFAYLIIPDKSTHANTQHLEIAAKKPGTSILFFTRDLDPGNIKKKSVFSAMFTGESNTRSYLPVLSFRFTADSIILREYTDFPEKEFFYTSYPVGQLLFNESFLRSEIRENDTILIYKKNGSVETFILSDLQSRISKNNFITKKFRLGTDRFGRDMLSRIILGTRVSLSVGFISVIISLLIGIILGMLAGYYGGRTDRVIMWLINVVWSVPTLLLVLSISMVLGKGFWQIFIAVGISMWVEVARIVRGQVMSIRKKEYIDAVIVLGMSDLRILFVHILPNILSPLIIIAASNFASAILLEAGLSFLGIGIQPPMPSWGTMIRDHYGFIIVDKAYMAFIPGLAIMLLVLAFTMLGNGLRDAADVRSA